MYESADISTVSYPDPVNFNAATPLAVSVSKISLELYAWGFSTIPTLANSFPMIKSDSYATLQQRWDKGKRKKSKEMLKIIKDNHLIKFLNQNLLNCKSNLSPHRLYQRHRPLSGLFRMGVRHLYIDKI